MRGHANTDERDMSIAIVLSEQWLKVKQRTPARAVSGRGARHGAGLPMPEPSPEAGPPIRH